MRVTRGLTKHRRRKRYFKEAKGFRGSRNTLWRNVIEATLQARKWSYIHRKQRRREMRKLWIMRINAAARQHGLTYASFMHKAATANLGLDRKALADIAVADPAAFRAIVESVN